MFLFYKGIPISYLSQLMNLAVITILFLIKIPSKDICIIYNSMKRSLNLNIMNCINFWYQMIF